MASRFLVRSATSADVPHIVGIERESFSDPWSPLAFREMIGPHALVAVEGGQVAGYVFARALADEGEVLNLAVRGDLRGRGIGRRLLDAVLTALRSSGVRKVYLEVRTSNAGARAFYEAVGFREVGRRRSYYEKPREDALVLVRDLGGEVAR